MVYNTANMAMVDCLTECKAFCCKNQRQHGIQIVFDFSEAEARNLRESGTQLKYLEKDEGYILEGEQCSELTGIKCRKHGQPSQPECCARNKVGGGLCTAVREAVMMKRRWSDVE